MPAQRQTASRSEPPLYPAHREFSDDPGATSERLAPSSVPPAQFFDAPDRSYKECGSVALMRAVLEDALGCFLQQFVAGGRRPRRLAKEAEGWFFSDDAHWPFAFVTICAVLGLDPEYVRLGLKRRRLRDRAEP